jgi:undecaprenyl diphosphate synthase
MDDTTRSATDRIVEHTAGGSTLRLNLMVSYSGREEILRATRILAERVKAGELSSEEIDEVTFQAVLFTGMLPDPDLLIRTSGEYRLSNFLLWQTAYTELHITSVLWPDFSRETLYAAVKDYQGRERRFGRVSASESL